MWLKLYSMCHMGREMERNWTSIYPTSTLWVQTCMVPPHTIILPVQGSWYSINRPLPLSFRCPSCCLHTWRLLAVSQVCAVAGISTFPSISRFLGHSFWVLWSHSKEESGFMAVPLVDKGVVVVAVGYDIAPKGRAFPFLTVLFPFSQVKKDDFRI